MLHWPSRFTGLPLCQSSLAGCVGEFPRRLVSFPNLIPRFGAAALLLLIAGCGIDASYEKLVVGKSYEHSIRAGNSGMQVPLPEGRWILVGWEYYLGEQAVGGILVQTEGRRIARMLDFYVPYHTEGRKLGLGLSGYRFCTQRDVLFLTAIERPLRSSYGGGGKDNCWGVDHRPMTFYGDMPEHLYALRDYAETNKLDLAVTMLVVRYRRRDGGPDRLSLNYYFNPETEGFEPPEHVEWRSSDWHRDRAYRDPKKKAYIAKLTKWGEDWEPRVDKGFRGKL